MSENQNSPPGLVLAEVARKLIERGDITQVIDIRTKNEFEAGHIEQAVNIDFYQPDFIPQIGKLTKDKSYLIYCRKGIRSAKAAIMFHDLGFQKIYELKNGYETWK